MSNILVDKEKRKEKFWISYIKGRIRQNQNFLGLISGATGSGKSWAGISICNMADSTFTPARIVMSMRELMKLINSGKVKSGSAILWDEAGIDASAKTWQSLTNRLINFLMQTFRHKRFILIFTTPYMEFVDASTRKLFHAEFQTVKINYENKKTKLKPQLIQYNSRMRKFYYKYLRIKTMNRGVVPLTRWNVPSPPDWLVDEYELIKTKFTDKLNKDIEKQLDAIETKKTTERKPLTEIQQKVMTLMAKFDDVSRVASELGHTERTIYFHISQARKKNWQIKEFLG